MKTTINILNIVVGVIGLHVGVTLLREADDLKVAVGCLTILAGIYLIVNTLNQKI